ncbi:stemmadenine O-acetyltransferase-like [Silene latifolia]|uniref:stemmadenine O-acetyltransferase-like n=1 Tax=Silene latifolia TaxID=37657 RepID=UPI003D77CFFB
MSNFKVEIKSKDMIKPFSETPNNLKTLQLSFLDQFAPPVLMPLIFYYQTPFSQHNNNTTTTTMLLKNSLSETLVQFYPLAGRVNGNLSIDCNDQGVEFYEADILASLAEVIANPDLKELTKLLPYAPLSINNNNIVTAVQVNHFSCGSMAIGVCMSHKIADGATVGAFIKAWARCARGDSNNDKKLVTFDSASFFPPMDLNGIYDPEIAICKEELVTRRLIFDKEKLDELKKQCDNEQLESPPTRAGVVSALLWKMFIKIARAKPMPTKFFGVSQVVNLRTIKSSPIPENYHGNLFWSTFAHTQVEPEIEYTEAVGKLRTAVKKIDTSYLEKIKTGECLVELQKAYESFSQGEADFCGVSSLIWFPLYEVNFGWGTPIWVSTTTLPFKNTVFLLPTKCGQGIEAWMNVLEHDVATLEADQEFCSLASPIIQL